jgi:outer membrane receptor protein involved in Fe transport
MVITLKNFYILIVLLIGLIFPTVLFSQINPESTSVNELPVITVQADRPDWESELSPGAIDVVIPDDFAGEQKELPDFLESIPGLHVNRRGGDGQYSTVSVRGSTAAQVYVYIDGVIQNLSGESVVDLSLIPVKNIERIEVYRGYIPARFSGAPIGGAINIVTKKPKDFGVKAGVGIKSFGGKEAEATMTAPYLTGSILLGIHHERSDGDFKYNWVPGWGGDIATFLCFNGESSCVVPIERRRQSNSFKNTDAILKWQDNHWYIKGAWKTTDRYYPQPTSGTASAFSTS